MQIFKIFARITLLFCAINCCKSYNILGLFPSAIRSHAQMFETLMIALAKRGHNVDYVSCFYPKKTVLGFNHIKINNSFSGITEGFPEFEMKDVMNTTFHKVRFLTETVGHAVCRNTFNNSAVANLKIEDLHKYDAVVTDIFFTDCMLAFAHYFDIPSIVITSSHTLPWAGEIMGIVDNPSYIPNYFATYSSKMNFLQRLHNTLTLLMYKEQYNLAAMESNNITKNFFGKKFPNLKSLVKKVSLVLLNSHPSINPARASAPNVVEVGGLHIETPKKLPKYFQKAVSSTKYNGTIYFNIGLLLKSGSISNETFNIMMDTFAELSYKVLLNRFEEHTPEQLNVLPSNVEFHSWIPQLEILCHENLKLFISYGDLMSLQEAVYCSVPVLGIPLFADQALNMKQAESLNMALTVNYDEITKNKFLETIQTLLDDSKYMEGVKKVSRLFKDRPMKPLETAVYWVEYVVRNGGAHHLKTIGVDLPWYQYYLLDVVISVVMSMIMTLITVWFVFCLICKCCCRKKS